MVRISEGDVLGPESRKRGIGLCEGLLTESVKLQSDLMQEVVLFRIRRDRRRWHSRGSVLLGKGET
jgi:hypothetical protein